MPAGFAASGLTLPVSPPSIPGGVSLASGANPLARITGVVGEFELTGAVVKPGVNPAGAMPAAHTAPLGEPIADVALWVCTGPTAESGVQRKTTPVVSMPSASTEKAEVGATLVAE